MRGGGYLKRVAGRLGGFAAFGAAVAVVAVGPENFRMEQVVPGAVPLTVTAWPNALTAINDVVTVRSSPTLVPWAGNIVGTSFPVTQTMFDAQSMGGALNARLALVSGNDYVQVQIGSQFSRVTQRGDPVVSFTSSSTIGINEGAALATPLLLNAPVRRLLVYSGPDMLRYELLGNILRFLDNGIGDYEAGATQQFAVAAELYNDKWVFQNIIVALTNVDELPTEPTFTPVTGVAPGSAAQTFTWTVADMAAGTTFPCAVTGASAARINGVAVASMAAFNVFLGAVVTIDLLPHSTDYLASKSFSLTGGGAAWGGTISATGQVVTGSDPDAIGVAIGSSGFVFNTSIFAYTVNLSVAFDTIGRYLLFVAGRTKPTAVSVAGEGSATEIVNSGGIDESIQIYEITIATAGTKTVTLDRDSGVGALFRNGVLAVKVTSTASGNNGTATLPNSYSGAPTTTTGLTVSTDGVWLAGFYEDADTALTVNTGTVIGSYLTSDNRRLYLLQGTSSATPSMTSTSGGPPVAIAAISLNKGALA